MGVSRRSPRDGGPRKGAEPATSGRPARHDRTMDATTRIVVADSDVDPQLQLASAPFATWMGVIEVDARGDALLLRFCGDEDRITGSPAMASRVEAALRGAGQPVAPSTGVWLPLATLYPVLEHLSPHDAFDVASRMAGPRAEHVGAPGVRRAMVLRAALVDGRAGWIGACPVVA